MNLYDVLEVSSNASKEVITGAYKILARRYHPDRNQGIDNKRFEEKMKELNNAYEILSDEFKRAEYDLSIKQHHRNQAEPKPKPQPRPQSQSSREQQKTNEYRSTVNADQKPKDDNKFPKKEWSKLFILAALASIVAIAVYTNYFSEDAVMARNFNQVEISKPTSGITYPLAPYSASSPLTIITPAGGTDYYIKLVKFNSNTIPITIFINGGDTFKMDVPDGSYKMKYASGTTWYGETHLFGPDTRYSAMDDSFEFSNQSGWAVELTPQTEGNLSETSLHRSEF